MSTTARLLQIARHVMGCGQASHREELENQQGRDSPLVYDGFTAELCLDTSDGTEAPARGAHQLATCRFTQRDCILALRRRA